MSLPNADIVNAIFEVYLRIRKKDSKLQDGKKNICITFSNSVKEAKTIQHWTNITKDLLKAVKEEYIRESGTFINWLILARFRNQQFLLLKTLTAALTYLVSQDDELRELVKSEKDIQLDYYLKFFDEIIKIEDEKSKELNEKNFQDFFDNVINKRRTFSELLKAEQEKTTASVEAKAVVETAQPQTPTQAQSPQAQLQPQPQPQTPTQAQSPKTQEPAQSSKTQTPVQVQLPQTQAQVQLQSPQAPAPSQTSTQAPAQSQSPIQTPAPAPAVVELPVAIQPAKQNEAKQTMTQNEMKMAMMQKRENFEKRFARLLDNDLEPTNITPNYLSVLGGLSRKNDQTSRNGIQQASVDLKATADFKVAADIKEQPMHESTPLLDNQRTKTYSQAAATPKQAKEVSNKPADETSKPKLTGIISSKKFWGRKKSASVTFVPDIEDTIAPTAKSQTIKPAVPAIIEEEEEQATVQKVDQAKNKQSKSNYGKSETFFKEPTPKMMTRSQRKKEDDRVNQNRHKKHRVYS